MTFDWSPLWLSLRYAGVATLFSILLGVPLAWWLAHGSFAGRDLLDAIANLPLILPPAVLAYYLLAAIGRWPLVFNWHVAVGLSTVYTLPVMMRMSRAAFAAADPSFADAARGLGAGEWRIFWRVTVPLAGRALTAAVLASFARAYADFGITAIVARHSGNANDTGALLLLVGAVAFAALYAGNRMRRGQAWA
jgi:molybdate transport system permease protein